MDFQLINLDCPACGSAMRGDPSDILFLCRHCGSGAILSTEGLEILETTALLPAAGHRAEIWKPAWKITADIDMSDRMLFGGQRTPSSSLEGRFLLPAFALPLPELARLSRGLSGAIGQTGEIPHEPCLGGELDLEDALTLLRYLLIKEEVAKPDLLASIKVEIRPISHRLCAIPFEHHQENLRCAITGIIIHPGREE